MRYATSVSGSGAFLGTAGGGALFAIGPACGWLGVALGTGIGMAAAAFRTRRFMWHNSELMFGRRGRPDERT